MRKRDRPHIVVPTPPRSEPFTRAGSGGRAEELSFTGNRSKHGRRLIAEFEESWEAPVGLPETEGTYLSFISFPGLELALQSLDSQKVGNVPELVSVKRVGDAEMSVIIATVYVPDGQKQYFLNKITAYVAAADRGERSNAALVDGIRSIRRATIRELWTDPEHLFPADASSVRWWEVWLRKRDGQELRRLTASASEQEIRMSDHYLGFADRTVVLMQATADQLAELFDSLDDFAELRSPHEIASYLPELAASEQKQWVDELWQRTDPADDAAPVVCILDRGVQARHPLLAASLAEEDLHSASPDWQHTPVVWPHGTEMAGLALYGDLAEAIASAGDIRLVHRLESVKLLPDWRENPPDLYGAITARAVDQPEISSPSRPRVFMLAVTGREASPSGRGADDEGDSPARESGKPTSWSATIDALSFGRAVDDSSAKFTYLDREERRKPRLFVISAGNIPDVRSEDDHLERSDAEAVEDPAQSWNAVVVGSYAEHDDMAGAPADFAGYVPIAPRGELSPVSRTSVSFDQKKWPFKPDVVASGGNYARAPDGGPPDTPENLAVTTTRFQQPGAGYFTTTRDTSAATAQVASIAARVCAAYPSLRPETVRALIVHSAQWTPAMQRWFDPRANNKGELVNRLRRYGMGVPDLTRALYSATDALTLIAESSIRPFERIGNSGVGKTREMNVHGLPWPLEQLSDLAETRVSMRVTLSYFVEPNPSNRGWSARYSYPSHGLRFDVLRPQETIEDFRKRINKRARTDGDTLVKLKTDTRWLFGSEQQKSSGSLHTDIWTGPAVDLASMGAIAVYPVLGWWRDRKQLDQSDRGVDYSLVVSIESPDVEVDLWTPVQSQIENVINV